MDWYDHQGIEKKWQEHWQKRALGSAQDFDKKQKAYILFEFPYPSGDGLHMGHLRSYTALDIIARKKRMEGKNVMLPIGWDAFGLPTENYALKTGKHPAVITKQNIETFRRQIRSLGYSVDWSREIDTTDPKYYHWTQWIFLQFFKHSLAYQATIPINWCPKDKIGLANEEVVDGKCERCGSAVVRKEQKQWMLKITAYADRLIDDLSLVEYPERVKTQQINWIGRSEGAEIEFRITNDEVRREGRRKKEEGKSQEDIIIERVGADLPPPEIESQEGGIPPKAVTYPRRKEESIKAFTTRPDTIFGATYMVIAPEHEIITKYKGQITNYRGVEAYIERSRKKSDLDRTDLAKEKTGVELKGIKAINPATKEAIPIWVADYVLASYGTGAIMAVPAHDERDWEFAKKFGLEIREVVVEQINERAANDVPRRIAIAIIENKKGEVLVQSDTIDGKTSYCLPGGGIDEGETEEQAVRREVKEETGYTIFTDVQEVGTLEANYFNAKRNVNRRALATCFALKLADDKRVDPKLTELEKRGTIENTWVSKQKATDLLSSKDASSAEDLPLFQRYLNNNDAAYTGEGVLINSGRFDGMHSDEAIGKITAWLEKKKVGKKAISYKLRDWVFSRQHYWGEPIPIIHCEEHGPVAVPDNQLPVELPYVEKYEPSGTGESPLATIPEFVNTTCPVCSKPAKRETDTMPNWAGSSWYYLRYCDPKNDKKFADKKKLQYWLPVDLYNGGMEHTTLHLLYSRFWHKFLFDLKLVPEPEPYKRRTSHGIILGEDGRKMSKSFGNVVNPDDFIKEYGADSVRTYEMFIGPFEDTIPWSNRGIVGVHRFLQNVYDLFHSGNEDDAASEDPAVPRELDYATHHAIKQVGDDIDSMRFNTAVSSLMQFVNLLRKHEEHRGLAAFKQAQKTLLVLLAPFAPHLCSELWEKTYGGDIGTQAWPTYDEKKLEKKLIMLVIQVNGKVRAKITVPAGVTQVQALKAALAEPNVAKYVPASPKKVVFVAGRLINLIN